jgi:hypothetical protein
MVWDGRQDLTFSTGDDPNVIIQGENEDILLESNGYPQVYLIYNDPNLGWTFFRIHITEDIHPSSAYIDVLQASGPLPYDSVSLTPSFELYADCLSQDEQGQLLLKIPMTNTLSGDEGKIVITLTQETKTPFVIELTAEGSEEEPDPILFTLMASFNTTSETFQIYWNSICNGAIGLEIASPLDTEIDFTAPVTITVSATTEDEESPTEGVVHFFTAELSKKKV